MDCISIEGLHEEAIMGEEVGIGAIDPDLNVLDTDAWGNVWIGGKEGLIRYAPLNSAYTLSPQLRVDQLMVLLEDQPLTTHSLEHGENHLTFAYQGLWYQAPKQVRYRHRLIGHDLDWIYSQNPYGHLSRPVTRRLYF